MRCGAAISLTGHTGHSEAIHSPEEWVSVVVSATERVGWSIAVVWKIDFSGFVSSVWALARAPANAAIEPPDGAWAASKMIEAHLGHARRCSSRGFGRKLGRSSVRSEQAAARFTGLTPRSSPYPYLGQSREYPALYQRRIPWSYRRATVLRAGFL